MSKGILYTVATPIGNLSDITLRALEVLKSVDIIACEDTRVSQKLLNHFNIKNKTISYHKFSEQKRSQKLLEHLNSGLNIALVSDAGTPIVSDPGNILIENVKKDGIKIVPIVGACAAIALTQSSTSSGKFSFIGFFPQKKDEIEKLKNVVYEFDIVFYESPNRILSSLENIKEIFGENTNVSIGRELTKKFEDIQTFKIEEMINYLTNSTLKGEITGIIHKKEKENSNSFDNENIDKLLAKGFSPKDISIILSELNLGHKNDIYKSAILIQNKQKN